MKRFLFVIAALAAQPVVAGEPGLKEGNAADAPKLSPEEQQKQFVLPDGFSIELVTSELQGAEKMVALNFDSAGRLWTMTATEYPLDTNDKQHADEARRKWQEGGKDRVLVIDEPLGPGPHTPRVFADGLVMPMSVLPYRDGAIVAHGPEILQLRDTDGDGRADERKVLLKGFGIQDSHTMAHQLMWLPDGTIFTVQGVLDSGGITDAAGKTVAFNYGKFASFQPDGTGFHVIGAGLNNTWGVLLQRNGHLWVQEANSFDHSIAPFGEGAHYHGWNEEPYIKDAPWQPGVGGVDLGSTGLSGLAQSEDRAGEPLFTSLCLSCHSAGGKGIGFAPPLDGSSKRDLPAVLLAMLEPDAAVENVFRPFHVRMRDGMEVEGFLKARSGNRATLQLMGGATISVNLLRAHTARYRNGHSVMPPLAAGLSDQQIADIAAFLRGL